jgi:hypothetical protein
MCKGGCAADIPRETTGQEREEKEVEKNRMKKHRGVFEKDPGSGVWWIQYFDAEGRRHREKIGSKGAAIKLVELRRTQRLEGRKLPKPRTRPLMFRELTDAALAYTNGKASQKSNVWRMKNLIFEFGNCPAEEVTPQQIEAWLSTRTEWAVATKNRYVALLKLVYRLAEEAQRDQIQPSSPSSPEKGKQRTDTLAH